MVEIRERVAEIPIYKPVEVAQPKPALFSHISNDDLLGYGIPEEWLADVQQANEDMLFDLADHLPQEATEALLELATGGTPQVAQALAADVDPSNVDLAATVPTGYRTSWPKQ